MRRRIEWTAMERPGWLEVGTGLVTYLILLALTLMWAAQVPDEQAVFRWIVAMAVNGAAGSLALLAAALVRVRDLQAFGFRSVEHRWLIAGVAFGGIAFGLSFIVEHVHALLIAEPKAQAGFQVAAQAGPLSFTALFVAGAILTPFGEEVLFRGVVARALERYGAKTAIVGSAFVYAAFHGPNVLFLLAFMVGILAGILLHRTGSIWPPLVLHVVYNGLQLIGYAMG